MKIPVVFLSLNPNEPARGYWDEYFIEKIVARPEFEVIEDADSAPEAVVVIHADKHYGMESQITEWLSRYKGVVLIVAGDEHGELKIEEITHPNMKIWLMTPHAGRKYTNVDRFIGEGFTPHSDLIINQPEKNKRWFFAGQVTHGRRTKCVAQLKKMDGGELIQTQAFAAGIAPSEYIEKLSTARVIPCPGGPATPDTFRFYETLEMGGIPIADAYSALNKNDGYWQMLFGEELPFPVIKDWNELPDMVNYFNDIFQKNANRIFAWWQMYKRNFFVNLIEDFCLISDQEIDQRGLTVLVPTSPVESNPDTSIIENTIATIRAHLPATEIIITFDGVRPEQEERRANYEEYVKKVLWMCNKVWKNVTPIVFEQHMHQVAMAREALKYVKTNKILYVEHDTPLTPDRPIDWANIALMVDSGEADLVRFHFEAFIPKEHEWLMIDKQPQIVRGVPAVRTIQWSQRPHVASTAFYRRILNDHFTQDARTFIEDKMHSVVISAYTAEQLQGWNKFKLWIYHPEPDIKRSYHTDGRGSESKYKMVF